AMRLSLKPLLPTRRSPSRTRLSLRPLPLTKRSLKNMKPNLRPPYTSLRYIHRPQWLTCPRPNSVQHPLTKPRNPMRQSPKRPQLTKRLPDTWLKPLIT
ncbi:hypothetical protein GGI13_001654, partial [Coemansia sp. RSA 455]